MALKKTVISPQGFMAQEAYHRVEYVRVQGKTQLHFNLVSYKDKATTTDFDSKSMSCNYDMDGANPFVQAYLHVKTLPEFADAIDC